MAPDPSLEEIRELVRKRDEALAWVARASADDGELDAAAGAFEAVNDKLAARAVRLLAALDAATGALERHMQWSMHKGARICAGCLEPVPCPDSDVITRALNGGNDSG